MIHLAFMTRKMMLKKMRIRTRLLSSIYWRWKWRREKMIAIKQYHILTQNIICHIFFVFVLQKRIRYSNNKKVIFSYRK